MWARRDTAAMASRRRQCPRCGTECFDTDVTCWACGVPLEAIKDADDFLAPQVEAATVCAFHPAQQATGACDSCDKPLCDHCQVDLFGKTYCKKCVYLYTDLPEVFRQLEAEAEARQRTVAERERLLQEMRMARDTQMRLLPLPDPQVAGLNVSGVCIPAREVGGDYYDFLELPEGQLAIVLGDVTGKGMQAALLMLMVKSCLYNQIERDPSTIAVMSALNRLLLGLGQKYQMMTCFYCVYDPVRSTLVYSNAGHNYPYHYQQASGQIAFLEDSVLPLGAVPDLEYEERKVVIEKGDRIFIYSDGIVEAQDSTGTLYGFPRFEEALGRASHAQPAEAVALLVQEAKSFQSGALQSDDMTLVVLQATTAVERAVSTGQTRWRGEPIELRLPSQLGAEKAAMAAAAAVAHGMGFRLQRIDDVRTVVAEACVNAAEHGNRLHPDAFIDVVIEATDNALAVVVSDSGPGFDPNVGQPDINAAMRGESKGRGWGLYLMERLADNVEYTEANEGGTAVRLTFNAAGGSNE